MRRIAFLSVALLAGCPDGPPQAVHARPYESCSHETIGEPCGAGPTECREMPESGHACTMPCVVDDDCFQITGFRARCEQFTTGRQCVIACTEEHSVCPDGTWCLHRHRRNGEEVTFCGIEFVGAE